MEETTKVRSGEEIENAIVSIYNNTNLTYSYREDVMAVLEWVLGGPPFFGLENEH